jgi:hypothetical protein
MNLKQEEDVHDEIRSGRPSIVTDEKLMCQELFSMSKRAGGRFL